MLLVDLRGFSAIAEPISGRDMLAVLDRYVTKMCEIAIANGGSIDKFIGDAVMVLFGAPHRLASHARRAVTCALQMQLAMDEINRDNEAMGLPHLYMGAGINTGRVLAGLLGSVQHYEYTLVGEEVNLASRIESLSLRGKVRHVRHKHGHRVAGIEFTSISQRVEEDIRYYVQLLIQGTLRK